MGIILIDIRFTDCRTRVGRRGVNSANSHGSAGISPAVAESLAAAGVGFQSWLRRDKPCNGLVPFRI